MHNFEIFQTTEKYTLHTYGSSKNHTRANTLCEGAIEQKTIIGVTYCRKRANTTVRTNPPLFDDMKKKCAQIFIK